MRQMCSHNELRETLVTVAVAMRGFERSWQAPRQAMQGRSRRGVAVLRETARTLQGEVCVVSPMVCRAEWRECDRKCTVTMSEAKEVGVKFRKTSSLTASKAAGSQPGIIKSEPSGAICFFPCDTTTLSYDEGTEVTLFAKAPNHRHFVEFTGGTG